MQSFPYRFVHPAYLSNGDFLEVPYDPDQSLHNVYSSWTYYPFPGLQHQTWITTNCVIPGSFLSSLIHTFFTNLCTHNFFFGQINICQIKCLGHLKQKKTNKINQQHPPYISNISNKLLCFKITFQ